LWKGTQNYFPTPTNPLGPRVEKDKLACWPPQIKGSTKMFLNTQMGKIRKRIKSWELPALKYDPCDPGNPISFKRSPLMGFQGIVKVFPKKGSPSTCQERFTPRMGN